MDSERSTSDDGRLRFGTYYSLALLLAIYICNFVDRNMISIVAEPMKRELHLHDWQIGLLGGLAFALFYVVVGVPIARLAEKRNRVTLIAILMVVWSAMTAICGLTRNYSQLLLARIGVGVGEAGCSPASHSLIGDLFPPERRASAMSIYSLGIPLGPLIAGVVGGWATQRFGWRAAFFVVAVPGVVLAILLKLTMREPRRGTFDAIATSQAPDFLAVLRHLLARRSFIHIALGGALATFANYAISTFAVPFVLRGFDVKIGVAASTYGLIAGIAASLGTLIGGVLVDRDSKVDQRAAVWIPALGTALSAPLYVLVLFQHDLRLMVGLLVVPAVIHYAYLGPTFGLTANMVDARMRATASAILLLVMNLIGLGLGPLVAGLLSDIFAQQAFAGGNFSLMCPGGVAAKGAAAALTTACKSASFSGLRWALIVASLFYAWAALHYLLAAVRLRADLAGDVQETASPRVH